MLRSLVGSEMCIRDRIKVTTAHSSKGGEANIVILLNANNKKYPLVHPDQAFNLIFDDKCIDCLLYTSDAADE